MKKKKRKKIVWLLMVLCIILFMIFILTKKDKPTILNPSKKNLKEVPEMTIEGRYLKLNGAGVFFEEYTGEKRSSEISHYLDDVTTKSVPKIYNLIKEYSDSELSAFYDKNSKNLYGMIGINNKDDFVSFAKKMQKCDTDFNSWDSLEVLRETFLDNSDIYGYAYAEYRVTYDNKKNVTFCIYVAKSNSNETPYIIDIVK